MWDPPASRNDSFEWPSDEAGILDGPMDILDKDLIPFSDFFRSSSPLPSTSSGSLPSVTPDSFDFELAAMDTDGPGLSGIDEAELEALLSSLNAMQQVDEGSTSLSSNSTSSFDGLVVPTAVTCV